MGAASSDAVAISLLLLPLCVCGLVWSWFCLVLVCLVFVMLSHMFIAALWSPAGKELTCDVYCDFVTFPYGMLGQDWTGVVFRLYLFLIPAVFLTFCPL